MLQSFPVMQILDDGKIVFFGQLLEEAERLFRVTAADNPCPVARKGIDTRIKIKGVSLEFDSGRLNTIEFRKGYLFKNPTKPYAKTWKNFVVIGERRIEPGMERAQFVAYLAAWEKRAEELGAKKTELEDLKEDEFRVSDTQ